MLDIAQHSSSKSSDSSATLKDKAAHKSEHGSDGARILLPTNQKHPMFQMGRDRRVAEREHEISSVMAGIVRRIVASK